METSKTESNDVNDIDISHLKKQERENLYKETMKHKQELDDIFYKKGFLMKAFPKFYSKIKETKLNIPYDVAKFYYANQAITQVFRPPQHEKVSIHMPIISYKLLKKHTWIRCIYRIQMKLLLLYHSMISFLNMEMLIYLPFPKMQK